MRPNLKDSPDAADRAHLEEDVRKILTRALSLIQSVTPRIWAREKQGA